MQPTAENPLTPFLEHQAVMILDGGLATTLESHGHDLDDPLWSAKTLLEDPDAVRGVHLEFLEAGADCIIAATYQASPAGFRACGLSGKEADEQLRRAVDLAIEARDAFWKDPAPRTGRLRPLVAASIGPYGAYLADGSEYTGLYDIDDAALREFHGHRWRVLAGTPADLIACETIPSLREAAVLRELLRETPGRPTWISFTCRDGTRLRDGSPLVDAVRACDAEPGLVAVGINCTAPGHVPSLIREARRATQKPLIVYPNSGESYDADRRAWVATGPAADWGEAPAEWVREGAAGVGGCCRIGPAEVARLRSRLLS